MEQKYEHVFSPIRINSMMLNNRIIASPMGHPKSHLHPSTTYYGGIGILDKAMGGSAAVTISTPMAQEDGLFDKYARDEYQENLSVMKTAGAMAIAEVTVVDMVNRFGSILGPSDMEGEPAIVSCTFENIEIIKKQAALNVKSVKNFGFDMALLHFAHDQLPALFMAPYFNHRKDQYGGSFENRFRLATEIVHAAREAIGPNYPLGIRLSAHLAIKGTYPFEEMVEWIQSIQHVINFVNVSQGMDVWYEANVKSIPTIFEPHMINRSYAKAIKEQCPDLIVCPVGGITNLTEAEDMIASGDADCVMLGRALNADPYLPKKALMGKEDDIVPCLHCSYCYHAATEHNHTMCSVNPRYLRENRVPLEVEPAKESKKVAIIGGGPAGMKAAVVACERGHDVTLYEQSDALGGQIKCSQYEKTKADLNAYRLWLINQVEKHTIRVKLGVKATRTILTKEKYDAILIAIGAEPTLPPISGLNQPNVMRAVDVYPKMHEVGHRAVIIGGGTIGCELGLELAQDDHEVYIIEMGNELSAQGHKLYKISLHQQMNKYTNLHAYLNTACQKIEGTKVYMHNENGDHILEADTIIIATGLRAKKEEAFDLYGIAKQTYMIGDCLRSAKVGEATESAYFTAYNL